MGLGGYCGSRPGSDFAHFTLRAFQFFLTLSVAPGSPVPGRFLSGGCRTLRLAPLLPRQGALFGGFLHGGTGTLRLAPFSPGSGALFGSPRTLLETRLLLGS